MKLFWLVLAFITNSLHAQLITTVAGNGTYQGYSGDGGPAIQARLGSPMGVTFDNAGNLYIADFDNNVIRQVNTLGIISTYAGTGLLGYSGDGGACSAAELYHPDRLTFDKNGNLFVLDQNAQVIRKITPAGIISTVWGPQPWGFGGDGGPLALAQFRLISGVAFDSQGNMYISDYGDNRIRKVNSSGIVSTFAGIGTAGYSGDGGLAVNAQLNTPQGVIVDAADNLYIPDHANHCIRKISTSGIITTYAGNGTPGYSGDGGQATNATLHFPWFSAFDNSGNLYVVDSWNYVVRKIDPSGIITTFAGNGTAGYSGDGGLATAAQMIDPTGICVDQGGNVYVANRTPVNVIRKITNCLTATLTQSPTDTSLCSSGNPSFSVVANNFTSVQWQVNTGTNWTDIANNPTYSGASGPTLSVSGATSAMNGNQYRCLLTNGCGSFASAAATLKVTAPVSPAISISTPENTICAGTPASFTSSVQNGGPAPGFQWTKNGLAVSNIGTYTQNNLANGDVIKCTLTSSASCVSNPGATSNSITMVVNQKVTPSIAIASSANNVCFGTPIIFTSSVNNEGSTPIYQWTKNGVAVGANSDSYSGNSFNDGDVIACSLTSNATCLTSATVNSAQVILHITPTSTPAIHITASANAICPGTGVDFTAASTNGGSSPSYQWTKNGNVVGLNSPSYTNNSLLNGDIVSCQITSTASCIAAPTAISNSIAMQVFQNPAVTLDHTATLCAGSQRQLDAGNYSSYLWNNGTTSRYQTVSSTGIYYVTVTDKNGCLGSDTTVINTLLSPPYGFLPRDTGLCSYGSLVLQPVHSFQSYLWSTGSSSSSITVKSPGIYWLQVKDNDQCKGQDSIIITAKECMKGLYVPTAFTPNNDGVNDVFRALLFGQVVSFRFTVYNRWGRIVFQTKDPIKGWDGKIGGQQQDSDVFIWTCTYQLEGESIKTDKGTTVLIR